MRCAKSKAMSLGVFGVCAVVRVIFVPELDAFHCTVVQALFLCLRFLIGPGGGIGNRQFCWVLALGSCLCSQRCKLLLLTLCSVLVGFGFIPLLHFGTFPIELFLLRQL